ncbi:carboxypeptidase-like regulatory domain-containing protein [Tenacibaculum crassostreae]|uniref:carboxypeptidase-like regulatory domain-containing protein n=1 Tax=Tenacibaculum crassostreae TaxID=502683 RepID=UPI0038946AC2
MKKGLFILYLFFSTLIFSQVHVQGNVVSNTNEPLEGASVYFNNTTIGSITNSEGNFELKAKEGSYTLVVSFLGYKTKQLQVTSINNTQRINIKLEEEDNLLNEVVIKKIVYDDTWKYNLSQFKQAFLGRSKLASECKIINEKDIYFDYNPKTNTFKTFCKQPLQIKHQGLGYKITYDLAEFTLQNNQLFFSGYAKYENLKSFIKNKWRKNRLETFNGSQMHFLRSLLSQNLKKDGFVINQFKRVLNRDRPSEEKIQLARELFMLTSEPIDISKHIPNPITPLDSAIVVLQKAKLPKHRDYLYKRNVDYPEMFSTVNNTNYLDFNDYLMVIYTREIEEDNYLVGTFGKRKKASGVQTSYIVLLDGKSEIDPSGILINPNAVFNEGYWGFEAFANMLPLDYQPTKN